MFMKRNNTNGPMATNLNLYCVCVCETVQVLQVLTGFLTGETGLGVRLFNPRAEFRVHPWKLLAEWKCTRKRSHTGHSNLSTSTAKNVILIFVGGKYIISLIKLAE